MGVACVDRSKELLGQAIDRERDAKLHLYVSVCQTALKWVQFTKSCERRSTRSVFHPQKKLLRIRLT